MAILGFSLMAMAIFLLDLWIKNHIEQSRKEGEETAVCGDRLLIRRYHNKGAMLDAGADRSSLVAALSVALTLGLTVLFHIRLIDHAVNLSDQHHHILIHGLRRGLFYQKFLCTHCSFSSF